MSVLLNGDIAESRVAGAMESVLLGDHWVGRVGRQEPAPVVIHVCPLTPLFASEIPVSALTCFTGCQSILFICAEAR